MSAEGIVAEYRGLKQETDADLLAMQMGDFYEFFEADARIVRDELDLKVSERASGGETYEMAGVPLTELSPYLKALVERGYRVAVADQRDDGDDHQRAIDRVVSPGTLIDPSTTDARYLAAVVRTVDEGTATYGLAFADVTTGQFRATELTGENAETKALTELYRHAPTEILPGPNLRSDDGFSDRIDERVDATITTHTAEAFAPGRARHALEEQFGSGALDAIGIADRAAAVCAAGALVGYVDETGTGTLASMTRLQGYSAADHVELDGTTQRTLELTETMTGGGVSLFDVIDHTVTSGGGRLLRAWLKRPRRSRGELSRRQSCVEALTETALAREEIVETLESTADLERLATRAVTGSADAISLARIRDSLRLLPTMVEVVRSDPRLSESPVAARLDGVDLHAIDALHEELAEALVANPSRAETGIIQPGYDETLAELVRRHDAAVEWIDTLEDREADALGVSGLTVGRNKTDGYYIQVPKSDRPAVPDHYEGIKTLKSSERYVTPELNEREREILRLEEERESLERELLDGLRDRVADDAEILRSAGRVIAEVDALCSLAAHAVRNDWTRPALVDGRILSIEGGRHPVVEQTTEFVPNDLRMDDDRRFLVVTGPNMSGKSTYMRQAALITLLAQVGSFVPADRARIGLVDGIYTRVGALDELAQGRSTFMVEMQELSNILHSATQDSLIVLDEVGRGTATYDGISIAWAATEYLHNEVGARTLFATHYHELTGLAETLPRVGNVHVAVAGEPTTPDGTDRGQDGEVTFLRTVKDGPSDRSYGIHVADMAGVPDPVVARARGVLERLRNEMAIEAKGGGGGKPVQAVFDLGDGGFKAGGGAGPAAADATRHRASADGGDPLPLNPDMESVLAEIRRAELDETPPIELMAKVKDWQDRLSE